jgi:hypothetical protein
MGDLAHVRTPSRPGDESDHAGPLSISPDFDVGTDPPIDVS